MAIIDVHNISGLIQRAYSIDDGSLSSMHFGEEFRRYLSNSVPGEYAFGIKEKPAGVVMCYGDDEGFPAILRSYRHLPSSVAIKEFGDEVARALQKSVEHYPTGEHNLIYAHFRLHGLALETVGDISAKIIDNSRIIRESLDSRGAVYEKFESKRPSVIDGFYLMIENGLGDDFEGLSLQLKRRLHLKKADGEEYVRDVLFAKVGFYLDTTNSVAYISNCQGRKVTAIKPTMKELEQKTERDLGHEYGRFKSKTGLDPRAYIVTKLFGLLKELNIEAVKAIRPNEHLMNIGNHRGFKANYDTALEAAGMRVEDAVYRVKDI